MRCVIQWYCTVGLQALLVRCSGHFVAPVQRHDDRLNLIQSYWCMIQYSHYNIIASCWTPTQGSLCWSLHSVTGGGGGGVSGRQASLWVFESSVVAVKFAFDSTQPGQSAAGRAAMEKPAEVFFLSGGAENGGCHHKKAFYIPSYNTTAASQLRPSPLSLFLRGAWKRRSELRQSQHCRCSLGHSGYLRTRS